MSPRGVGASSLESSAFLGGPSYHWGARGGADAIGRAVVWSGTPRPGRSQASVPQEGPPSGPGRPREWKPGVVLSGPQKDGGVTSLPLPVAARARARYVDVLNPGGPQRSEPALAPADFFAPLAPLPIPTHLFGPDPGRQRGSSCLCAASDLWPLSESLWP